MGDSAFKLDFIGIGSGKCGSTWLYENIVKHPQVSDRNLKELNYFSYLYEEQPFSWYQSQFDWKNTETIKGEFSVTYMRDPLAAVRIRKHFPDVKILAIIRNPVGRTYSNYLHSIRKGDISPSFPFAEYIEDEVNLGPARYYEILKRFYDEFPREQIKVVLLEEFSKDIPAGMRDVYGFLGVDPDFLPEDVFQRSNVAKAYKWLWLENFLVRTYISLSRRGHTKMVKRLVDSGLGQFIRKLNADKDGLQPMDESSRAKLVDYYAPRNEKLAELLERDLGCWATPAKVAAEKTASAAREPAGV